MFGLVLLFRRSKEKNKYDPDYQDIFQGQQFAAPVREPTIPVLLPKQDDDLREGFNRPVSELSTAGGYSQRYNGTEQPYSAEQEVEGNPSREFFFPTPQEPTKLWRI